MENLASQYTVLVVDDVPTNVMLVQAILKKEGYTLLTTDSGELKRYALPKKGIPILFCLIL